MRISELEELNELLREKVKKTESDLWDKEQLRQVYSEKSLNLDSKVRELEARNQKDFVWRGREISRLNDEVDELKEKLESAEKRIAEQREYYEGVIADGSKRIAEPEARTVTLPDRKSEIFWPGDADEFDSLGYVIAVKSAIRGAGIGVKGG
ncbi:ead/Ea22-like family protein [Salmonella enterica]